ncbi:hypothetical protein NFI95_13195 [Acetobacteraceae bacterium KSS8]|uniref:Lipoprotein n=1 Tax=Endosaccharibacter trunci TaxID=2812733 RepID=A0ABT1W934_9PROT|nr:hypothetical protein [Acetobacteraceae bacterium KSS8]
MKRLLPGLVVALTLGGCVSNSLSTQNMMANTGAGGFPVASPARRVVRVSPNALLANAKLITVNKTTTAGAELRLASPLPLDRTCAPDGDVIVKLITPPDHGSVTITHGTVLPNFTPADGPQYLCNSRKALATLVTYRATPGFTGDDAAVIQIFFPDGRAPSVRYNITVD